MFDYNRGFGFLTSLDDNRDYFVHISRLRSKDVYEGDFVNFQLAPSVKKVGTQEAVNVSKVSELGTDFKLLTESYFRYDNYDFKKNVFNNLPLAQIFLIVEREIKSINEICTGDQRLKFLILINQLIDLTDNLSIKDGIKQICAEWAEQVSNDQSKVELWLNDIMLNPPAAGFTDFFVATDIDTKNRIISKVHDDEKPKLIKALVDNLNPDDVLQFVGQFVKNANGFSSFDFYSKLDDSDFWAGKKYRSLFTQTLVHYDNHLEDSTLMPLFYSGFPVKFRTQYVMENIGSLTRNQIKTIFRLGVLQNDALEFFYSELVELHTTDDDNEFLNWLYQVSKLSFNVENFKRFDQSVYHQISGQSYFALWEQGVAKLFPSEIVDSFLMSGEPIVRVERWLEKGIISSQQLREVLERNIRDVSSIATAKEFYALFNLIECLMTQGISAKDILENINDRVFEFYQMAKWLISPKEQFVFDFFRDNFTLLNSDHQILVLKKAFQLMQLDELTITTTDILNAFINSNNAKYANASVDVSVDLIVHALRSIKDHKRFMFESEMLSVILNNMSPRPTDRFQIAKMFDECAGRYEPEYDWKTQGEIKKNSFGDGKFYYAISFPINITGWSYGRYGKSTRQIRNPNFDILVEAVKKIPGRKWNQEEGHWGVPSLYEEDVLKFAKEHRFFLDFDANHYSNNIHLAQFKRASVPSGIKYCEGRLAHQKHRIFKTKFWWCANQECFNNCETHHKPEEWLDYTLLDFVKILGFNVDSIDKDGERIENGMYYQFVSTVNRFNRLLERMYCEECSHILFPLEQSNFAHYRVVRFWCQNSNCSQHKKEVYLHHCLNGNCNEVIDSRRSGKCTNGLFICSNLKCGSCCSNEMFKRRIANLRLTGGHISQTLLDLVNNNAGHLERLERFCYKCGKIMDVLGQNKYTCKKCEVIYDISSTAKKPSERKFKNKKVYSDTDDLMF